MGITMKIIDGILMLIMKKIWINGQYRMLGKLLFFKKLFTFYYLHDII